MVWTKTLPLEKIEIGDMRNVVVDDERILLCRIDKSEIRAISDQCTHDGSTLMGGQLSGHVVECPRHGAKFDVRSGEALCMPASSPVFAFNTRISPDGWVEVELEDD